MLEQGPPDWEGLWFRLHEEECGDYVGIRFGLRAASGEPSWTFVPHTHYDGIGGFGYLLRERAKGGAERTLPVLREARAPGLFRRIWVVLKTISRKPRRVAQWRLWDPKWSAEGKTVAEKVSTAVAHEVLDTDRTRALAERARAESVSLNSLLFWALTRAAVVELGPGPRLWMVPVNMRGLTPARRDTANHASFLQIEVKDGASVLEVHRQIRDALRARAHWGIWLTFSSIRVFGYSALKRMFLWDRKMGRAWTGTFSNIGAWDGVGEEWLFCPPVAASLPVATGAVICDGRLALTLQAHPAVSKDPVWARRLLDRWLAGVEGA